jgi:hypothetical protein
MFVIFAAARLPVQETAGHGGKHPLQLTAKPGQAGPISVSISATWRRSMPSAGSQAQTPVSRTSSNSRISASRSPSRCARG